jgi:hypothetical protein
MTNNDDRVRVSMTTAIRVSMNLDAVACALLINEARVGLLV